MSSLKRSDPPRIVERALDVETRCDIKYVHAASMTRVSFANVMKLNPVPTWREVLACLTKVHSAVEGMRGDDARCPLMKAAERAIRKWVEHQKKEFKWQKEVEEECCRILDLLMASF